MDRLNIYPNLRFFVTINFTHCTPITNLIVLYFPATSLMPPTNQLKFLMFRGSLPFMLDLDTLLNIKLSSQL
jgi:hypothetical protein